MYKRIALQRVTEGQLASIVASAMDAIISTSADQRIILFNEAAEKMFLYRAVDVIGQPLSVLIPDRFRHMHGRHVDNFGHSGVTSRSMQSPGQLVGLRSNGEEFPIEAMISHAETQDGMIYAVIIRDITERVRTEKARQEFLAMLGHELRNPLAAISNAVFLLGKRVKDPQLERTLSTLDRQVAHMSRLVNDLVDTSRVTRGVLDLQREPVDLASLIEQAVGPFRHRFEERGIALHASLPGDTITLDADPVRLNQVIGNLLDNAVKYNEPGGEVWVEACSDGETAMICVRDNGEGIPEELLPHLFEPFVQGRHRSSTVQGGLGLGLTLCHRIVALHGGTFGAVTNGEHKGAEFVIRLPVGGGARSQELGDRS